MLVADEVDNTNDILLRAEATSSWRIIPRGHDFVNVRPGNNGIEQDPNATMSLNAGADAAC